MSRLVITELFFIILFSKFGFIHSIDSDSSLHFYDCGPNNTNNINLNSSLNKLFSELTSIADSSSTGFANTTVYSGTQNQLNGLIMCYIDSSQDHCSQCLNFSMANATEICPNSSTATFTYNWCFLRYSTDNFIASLTLNDPYPYRNYNVSNSRTFINTVSGLMDSLRQEAISGSDLYAYNNTTDPGMNHSVYGLVQCSRDLNPNNCDLCLQYAIGNLSQYMRGDPPVGLRVTLMSCYVRYELYPLSLLTFKSLAPAPTPTPSPILLRPSNDTASGN